MKKRLLISLATILGIIFIPMLIGMPFTLPFASNRIIYEVAGCWIIGLIVSIVSLVVFCLLISAFTGIKESIEDWINWIKTGQ